MFLQYHARSFAIFLFALVSACADGGREQHATPDLRTHFVVRGSGEPVVLLHGLSQTHEVWLQTSLYEDLARDHTVIAVDLRGHGLSDKPHEPSAYGPNLHSDLVDLLDHLEIDKAHFVGFSLGASVVGDLLINQADRVQTATLASGFFTTWHEDEEDFARRVEQRAADADRHPWEPQNQDYRALAALVRGTRFSSVSPEQIGTIRTPTLIVFGSIELEHMSVARKQQLRELPTSIEMLVIDGADHDSEQAAVLKPEFVQAVRMLIASNRAN